MNHSTCQHVNKKKIIITSRERSSKLRRDYNAIRKWLRKATVQELYVIYSNRDNPDFNEHEYILTLVKKNKSIS